MAGNLNNYRASAALDMYLRRPLYFSGNLSWLPHDTSLEQCWVALCLLSWMWSEKHLWWTSAQSWGSQPDEKCGHEHYREASTDLSRYSGLDVVILCVADLGVEVEHGANLYRCPEPDVVHVHAEGPGLAKNIGVGPGQLESLPHDKSSKYFVEPVPVFRLADNQVLQFSIFKPDRVLGLHAGFEWHGFVVDSVDEEVMNDVLLFEGGRNFEQRVLRYLVTPRTETSIFCPM